MTRYEMTKAYYLAHRHEPDPTAAERFWPKVNKDAPNGCWEWTGSLSSTGCGQLSWHQWPQPAHRIVFWLQGVTIPEDRMVDHICKNRKCVNPAHLRIVDGFVNYVENSDSPSAKNARKTHCVHGHPLFGENLARVLNRGGKGRQKGKKWIRARVCLTCYPGFANHPRRFWFPQDLAA